MKLKKRVIFTLLYSEGNFVLSRNFRKQIIGDFNWLKKNYNFQSVSFYIDELVVLDVSETKNINAFSETIIKLSEFSFVPISAGGGIDSLHKVKKLLNSGCDKVMINSNLFKGNSLVEKISKIYGNQCIVGSIDILKKDSNYLVYSNNGNFLEGELKNIIEKNNNFNFIGELYLNSINQDGTGQGLDIHIAKEIRDLTILPIILSGGIGKAEHIIEGLLSKYIDAVSTAHLLNFIGNGLEISRNKINSKGLNIASWENLNSFNKRLKN